MMCIMPCPLPHLIAAAPPPRTHALIAHTSASWALSVCQIYVDLQGIFVFLSRYQVASVWLLVCERECERERERENTHTLSLSLDTKLPAFVYLCLRSLSLSRYQVASVCPQNRHAISLGGKKTLRLFVFEFYFVSDMRVNQESLELYRLFSKLIVYGCRLF